MEGYTNIVYTGRRYYKLHVTIHLYEEDIVRVARFLSCKTAFWDVHSLQEFVLQEDESCSILDEVDNTQLEEFIQS